MNRLGGSRIEVVDSLRGIAVLSVCVSHLMSANCGLPHDSILWKIGTHGWLGVEVFFVISGFIIPYALHRSSYRLQNFPKFLLKRIIRLDPPYVAAIVFAILVKYLASRSPNYSGEPFDISIPQVLLHFAYLNAFFDYPWVISVFWTLAIEFQYYLAVGLLFPWIITKSNGQRIGLFVVMGLMATLFPQHQFLFHYLFLFMLGMLSFQFHAKIISLKGFWISLPLLAVGACYTLGPLRASAGVATALIIGFFCFSNKFLRFMGAISYSLYLVHAPIGRKFVNLGGRYVDGTTGGLAVVVAGLLASILGAWLLYTMVERPAQRWSSSINYLKRPAIN